MIPDKDISVVVQGPILTRAKYDLTHEITKIVCLRVKEVFPNCELILSTWKGEQTEHIKYDKLILNNDPLATWFDYNDHNALNNCNRLIVSTFSGIQNSTRKYVLKLRSDLFILSPQFLKYFNKYPHYNLEYKYVKSRILAFSMWSIQGHKTALFTMPKPFHISDWAYFGYREDLLDLYSVALVEEPQFSQWFLNRCKPFFDVAPNVLWRMPPEQYITSSFFNKFCPIELEHTADDSQENMKKSWKLIANNFIVLDQTQFSLLSLKHFCFQFSRKNHEWFMYHHIWLRHYINCIDNLSTYKLRKKISIIKNRRLIILSLFSFLRFIDKHGEWISRFVAYFIKDRIKKINIR